MIGSLLKDRYEVTQAISEGPIFDVYVARDRLQGNDVSIRSFRKPYSSEGAFVEKVAQIIRRLSIISQPNLERLVDVEQSADVKFVVGQFTPGTSLAERIRRLAPFSVPVSVSLGISVCEALKAIHVERQVHGDVAPHNVYVEPDGTARLQCAGIWEAYSMSASAGLAMLPLMAPYLAPEVHGGEYPTPQSDVYSVGVVLYELITGRMPFTGETASALAIKHATQTAVSPRTLNGSIPVALEEIIKKCLSKDPKARYADGGELLHDLRLLQDAVRFGRNVGWPLKQGAIPKANPVAPRMSAASPTTASTPTRGRKQQSRRKVLDDEYESDLPAWLKMGLYIGAIGFVFMVVGYIGFNLKKPKDVTVPNIKGLTLSEADAMCKNLGLTVRVRRRETNEKYRTDVILDVDPAGGQKVREGGTVGVVLSAGSKFVEVPDLNGVTLDQAKTMLEKFDLSVEEPPKVVSDSRFDPGIIIKQIPEARTKIERGSSMRVEVSGDPLNDRKATTRVAGRFEYTLKIRLTDVQEEVNLRVDMTDDKGTKTVYEAKHAPGETVEVPAEGTGDKVIFRIFYNGEMVKQVTQNAPKQGAEQ